MIHLESHGGEVWCRAKHVSAKRESVSIFDDDDAVDMGKIAAVDCEACLSAAAIVGERCWTRWMELNDDALMMFGARHMTATEVTSGEVERLRVGLNLDLAEAEAKRRGGIDPHWVSCGMGHTDQPYYRLEDQRGELCPTNCGSQFSVAVTREGRTMCRCGHDWSVPSLCPECGKPIQVRVGERSSRYRCPDGHTWGVP